MDQQAIRQSDLASKFLTLFDVQDAIACHLLIERFFVDLFVGQTRGEDDEGHMAH
uniref:Uncharacterized protein n=1 Tax=Romanomermis culicivorax TaxID=13658 RepID=A0A915K3E6_ROMCU